MAQAHGIPGKGVTGGFEQSPVWFGLLRDTALPTGELAETVRLDGPGGPLLLPLARRTSRWKGLPVREVAGLSACYTTLYQPPGLDLADVAGRVALWARGLRAGKAAPDRVLFEALDPAHPGFTGLSAGLAGAGYRVESFFHFGNWYLDCRGLRFDAYWAARDGRLRNSVDRKAKALARAHRVETLHLSRPPDSARAAALYDQVQAASWKQPEPFPLFMPGLVDAAFAAGAGEMAVLLADGQPVAAQLWLFGEGRATIFKLAHDSAWDRFSPGSVLSRDLMRRHLEAGQLAEIDLGRGDDPYKQLWLPQRRERWGLAAHDPRRPVGLALAARNLGAWWLKRLRP